MVLYREHLRSHVKNMQSLNLFYICTDYSRNNFLFFTVNFGLSKIDSVSTFAHDAEAEK